MVINALLQFGQNTGLHFKFDGKHFTLCIMAVNVVKKNRSPEIHCLNIMSIKLEAYVPLKQKEKRKEIILHVVSSVLVFDVM